jgi:DnaD/phage-associated family protein
MNNINGFTFFRNYHDSLNDLPLEDKKEMLVAIDDFIFEDIEPEFTGFKQTIWKLIKPNLISSKSHSRLYQDKTKKKSKKIKSKSNENQNEISDILENKNKNKEENKKRKEREKEEEEKDIIGTTTTNIYSFLEENFGRTISSLECEKLDSWIKEFNEEIVKHAIELSVMNNAKKFSYVEGILRNWKASGYKTLEDIKEYEDAIYSSRSRRGSVNTELFDYNWLEDDDE